MNIYEDLQRLDQLRRQGILTDEEFEQEKARLLAAAEAPKEQSSARNQGARNAPAMGSGYSIGEDKAKNGTYALLLHVLLFVPSIGWLIVLIMWLVKKGESPLVRQHGAAVMNMLLSTLIYVLVFMFIIGTLLIAALGARGEGAAILFAGLFYLLVLGYAIANLVFIVMNAIKASNGQPASYPLALRLIDTSMPELTEQANIENHFGS